MKKRVLVILGVIMATVFSGCTVSKDDLSQFGIDPNQLIDNANSDCNNGGCNNGQTFNPQDTNQDNIKQTDADASGQNNGGNVDGIINEDLSKIEDAKDSVDKDTSIDPNSTTNVNNFDMNSVHPTQGKQSAAFYKPNANANMDYNNASSKYCFARSKETQHFYVFWEAGFGNDPLKTADKELQVDTDDLLKKAEMFYYVNVNKLKMTDGNLINGYKMQIYLQYQKEWLATGSGYDEKIGALWVSPSTCKPVGSTIAHEIGHSFQYMIAANQLSKGEINQIGQTGFRYGLPGSNGGNAFWEVCAQWQSYNVYPEEMFTWYHMDTWFKNYHRSMEHELTRYQNYWWLNYASEKHGMDVLQNIWKKSKYPEDAYQTYMRLYLKNDVNAFYNELFEYASKAATFDFNACRQYCDKHLGKYNTTLYPSSDGYSQVAYANCPEANGFNLIPLETNHSSVTVNFKGLAAGSALANQDPGKYIIKEQPTGSTRKYNSYQGQVGYRYGFVSMTADGKRTYSQVKSNSQGSVTYTIPSGSKLCYFVVLGAPDKYVVHAWDDNESNDVQCPYAVKISYK